MPEKKHNPLTITTPSDLETVITRVFDAPRDIVFDALTKPEHLSQWWGPRGAIVTDCESDLRVGGAWRRTLRTPGGQEMTMRGVYREIAAPARLVSTECYVAPSLGNPEWLATITLEESGGKTTFTNRLLHPTKEQRDGHLQSGMDRGTTETFDRMAEYLEWQKNPMEREIELIRIFDAPRELVYEAWTDPKHMTQWWGPETYTNHNCRLDVRAGGAWQITMRSPDGVDFVCEGTYKEVLSQEKLVFTNDAVDKTGKQLLEALTTVTFAEHEGKTKLTLKTSAKGLVEYAPQMLRGMAMGWNQSFDKLTKLLAG